MPWSRFRKKRDMPEGLWVKCKACNETLFNKELEENLFVCTSCSHHFHMSGQQRLDALLDRGSFEERWSELTPLDRLGFVDKVPYPEKLEKARLRSGSSESAIAGTGTIDGQPVAVCVLDFSFMGGSMGTVAGEKVTRTVELGTTERIPVVVVSCSGGARMHEGALSLMQMGKTSAALARHHDRRGLFISVLANPTTGGVMASFAALGDLIFAEPKALIGFAGPRVIQETLRTELPEGFQTSEFLMERGFVDRIVTRHELRNEIGRVLGLLWHYDDAQRAKYQRVVQEDDEPAAETPEGLSSEPTVPEVENRAAAER